MGQLFFNIKRYLNDNNLNEPELHYSGNPKERKGKKKNSRPIAKC
jgi:hypothetical protein